MPDDAKQLFVEKAGLHFMQLGMPRMAGRIFGWLLISDSPTATMGELVKALKASKGSISSMTRLLIRMQLIELASRAGERRDFYGIREDAWVNALSARVEQARDFRKLAERGLEALAEEPPSRRERLKEMLGVFSFLERELPLLTEDWKRERGAHM
jgi:DNA-binding transcriptional regulator GbsR (MarR family)